MEEREPSRRLPETPAASTQVNRRNWLKASIGGGAGLALGGLLDVRAVKAASQQVKLSNVSEFTTSCNFCSCGCGMIAAVRDGKLLTMEGDYDHIVNRGALCVKGISTFATHASPCGGYLKTYDGEGNESVLLADWTSLHLDIVARDRGLKRRAASLYDL